MNTPEITRPQNVPNHIAKSCAKTLEFFKNLDRDKANRMETAPEVVKGIQSGPKLPLDETLKHFASR